MGCDIHCYIEYKPTKNKNWYSFGEVNVDRNYILFGIMAGVRYCGCSPVVEPKGIPKDISWYTADSYTLYVVDKKTDEEGCCTKEQVKEWNAEEWDEDKIVHPDWHTPSWLTFKELEKVNKKYKKENGGTHFQISAIIASMKELGKTDKNSRLVFWFDN